MGWNALEPAPGVYSSSYLRNYALFFAHLPRGTRVDVDVEGTPRWASGSRDTAVPPRDDADFAAFLTHIARRFGGRVSAYEIGDEEDERAHWAGSVAQYVALLRSAYGAIKGADRHATVILGGLAGNDYRYLDAVYAAGGGRYFDAVAVHTDDACDVTAPTVYARDRGTRMVNRWYFLGVSSVHAVMAAHHAGGKPIYMTEIGWSSTAARVRRPGVGRASKLAGVSAARQAAFLTAAYRCLAQPPLPLRARRAVVLALRRRHELRRPGQLRPAEREPAPQAGLRGDARRRAARAGGWRGPAGRPSSAAAERAAAFRPVASSRARAASDVRRASSTDRPYADPRYVPNRLKTLIALAACALALGGIGAAASGAQAAAVGVNVAATSGDFFHSREGDRRDPREPAGLGARVPRLERPRARAGRLQHRRDRQLRAVLRRAAGRARRSTSTSWGSPAWANGGSTDVATPPTNDADYAGFVNYLVNAFHGRVTAWEIWNEEDNSGWWTGTPAQYVALLQGRLPGDQVRRPERDGDRRRPDRQRRRPTSQQLYAAGAKGSFDAVGVHTDTACNITSPYVFEYNPRHPHDQPVLLPRLHRDPRDDGRRRRRRQADLHDRARLVLDQRRVRDRRTGPARSSPASAEQTQATYLEQAYHCLAQPQYSYVKAAMWFELFDDGTRPPTRSTTSACSTPTTRRSRPSPPSSRSRCTATS